MPNPRLLRTAARLQQKGFRLKNRLLSPYEITPGDITLYVLQRNKSHTATKPFTLLATVQNFGQDVETTAFRNRIYFEVAESEAVFGENADTHFGVIVGKATHVSTIPNGELFEVNQGDEYPIIQTDFSFKIFASLTQGKFNPQTDV